MNRKKLFSKTILDRGYQYYSEGTVEDIDISDKLITAVVWGSEGYEVEITLSDGEIEDMYCSCPYAADREYCKHMAAVSAVLQYYQQSVLRSRSEKLFQTDRLNCPSVFGKRQLYRLLCSR